MGIYTDITRFYLYFTLTGLLCVPTGYLVAVDTPQTQTHTEQAAQPETPLAQKWRKKKKKKPTIGQSWKKVVTLDWDAITPHDERNLLVSTTCAAILYSCYYLLTTKKATLTPGSNALVNPTPDGNPAQSQTDAKKKKKKKQSSADIVTPKPPLWSDETTNAHTVAMPSIGQHGLTCGNHAFINTRDVLAEIAKHPDQILTPEHLKTVLCTAERGTNIEKEIVDTHDPIVRQQRTEEVWKNYIKENIKKSLPQPTLKQRIFSFFGLWTKPIEHDTAIDNLTTIIFNKTYRDKKEIIFCSESSENSKEEVTKQLKSLINANVFDPKNSTVNEKKHDQCLALINAIDPEVWLASFSKTFAANTQTVQKALSAVGRGSDLESGEITRLVESMNLDAPFETKMNTSLFPKDADGNVIIDGSILDDQKIEFTTNNPGDMNGKMYVLETGIRTVITGHNDFYLIKAIKEAYRTQPNFSFGFVFRETDPSRDYETIKTMEPTHREETLRPMLDQRAEGSMTHWISVVLHRINGVNHYYVTDSLDTEGMKNAKDRNSIKILIEALETNNHY